MGAAARRANLPPLLCDAPIYRRPVCFVLHTLLLGPVELGGFSRVPADGFFSERIRGPRGPRFIFSGHWASTPPPRPKTFKFLSVAGGKIERSCYCPHPPLYVNTERARETMRETTQATLPQGRTTADGCKPRPGRDDRKWERSFSGRSRDSGL